MNQAIHLNRDIASKISLNKQIPSSHSYISLSGIKSTRILTNGAGPEQAVLNFLTSTEAKIIYGVKEVIQEPNGTATFPDFRVIFDDNSIQDYEVKSSQYPNFKEASFSVASYNPFMQNKKLYENSVFLIFLKFDEAAGVYENLVSKRIWEITNGALGGSINELSIRPTINNSDSFATLCRRVDYNYKQRLTKNEKPKKDPIGLFSYGSLMLASQGS